MIADEEIDMLREIADRVRNEADFSYYGSYNGGDPREFCPDVECSTDDERALHAADCAAWERGEYIDRGSHHQPLDAVTVGTQVLEVHSEMGAYKTVHHYGLGMVTYVDEELVKIAQDLDDVIDRIRQVAE